jgi:hypothetical protein
VLVAVLLVLSEEFMSARYPMEELQLLLERRQKSLVPCKAVLVPLFYGATLDDVNQKVQAYSAADVKLLDKWKQQLAKVAMYVDSVFQAEQREIVASGNDLALHRQWAIDLEEVQSITGLRSDQVCVMD